MESPIYAVDEIVEWISTMCWRRSIITAVHRVRDELLYDVRVIEEGTLRMGSLVPPSELRKLPEASFAARMRSRRAGG